MMSGAENSSVKSSDYKGERELLAAFELLADRVAQCGSMRAAVPCVLDASYVTERGTPMPASLSLVRVNDGYSVNFTTRLPRSSITSYWSTGDEDKVRAFIEQLRDPDAVGARLADTYRAWFMTGIL